MFFSFVVAKFQIGASSRAHQRRKKEEEEEEEEQQQQQEQDCFFFRCKVPLVAFWFLLAMSADSCESKC